MTELLKQARTPLADPAAEEARTAAYWLWLRSHHDAETLGAMRSAKGSERVFTRGRYHWVELVTPEDADYEAYFMEHSIGHSFGKYSAMGGLYSLRNEADEPELTILELDGRIVHARAWSNTRARAEIEEELYAFADAMFLKVVEDRYPFDFFPDPTLPHAEIRLFSRDDAGQRRIEKLVIAGGVEAGTAIKVMEGMTDNLLPAEVFGLPGPARELVMIASTDAPVTCTAVSLRDLETLQTPNPRAH